MLYQVFFSFGFRDLGEYIRSWVGVVFGGGSNEPRDARTCDEIHTRLNNIASNKYKKAFYANEVTSASG